MMFKREGKSGTPRSLATTLVAVFLVLSVGTQVITYVPQLLTFIQARQESVRSQQELIAKEAALTVAHSIQGKFGELEAVVGVGIPISGSQDELVGVLRGLLGLDFDFRQLMLLDSQGQELARASRLSQVASGQLMNRVEGDFFAKIVEGNRYISPVYVDEASSEPIVVIAVPVTDVFGDFQGALMAEVTLKFMWDLVDSLEIGEAGLAYVVDRQGNRIAFGDISRVLRGERASHLGLVSQFMQNPVPAGETVSAEMIGINGEDVAANYVPLGMPDWAVVTELPMAEARRPGIRNTMILGSSALLMAGLNGVLVVLVVRRLTAPLLALTETATRIAGGEIDLQATMAGSREVARLAGAFNNMTAQLRDFIGNLEQRVANRTRNLQAAADVARVTTAVLDPDELVRQTGDLIRDRFDLYYVGLFLIDEEQQFAVLRAGTGEAGRKMLEQGHQLEVGGESMIGQCTARAEARIAFDVGEEAVRFDNPLLPETRSEMALPLRSRGRVIGAVTVQSVEAAAFDEADIAVMQTMADQVAVAIDNARLFADAQSALEDMEATQRRYLGRVWAEYAKTAEVTGYDTQRPDASSLDKEVLPEIQQALQVQDTAQGAKVLTEEDGHSALVLPLTLRGQVIGALGIHDQDETRQWTDEEIALAEAIVARMTLAAENLRLLDETQSHAARERLTSEIAGRVRETLDIDMVLQAAVREISEAMDVAEVELRMSGGVNTKR
jgi:GAF domain-containing protein/HAMP domain-containing protein